MPNTEKVFSDDYPTTPRITILVVEDNDPLRWTVAEYLCDSGFNVLEAANGDEAINMLMEAEGRTVDIVFSDIRMPGLTDGFRLARWVRAHRPGVQIILASAYAGLTLESANLGHSETLLQKPYRCSDLVQRFQALALAV